MSAMAQKWGARALFIGLNAGLLALIWVLVIAPIGTMIGERTQGIAARREVLARFQTIASQAETAGKFVRAVRERNSRGGLLEGGAKPAARGLRVPACRHASRPPPKVRARWCGRCADYRAARLAGEA